MSRRYRTTRLDGCSAHVEGREIVLLAEWRESEQVRVVLNLDDWQLLDLQRALSGAHGIRSSRLAMSRRASRLAPATSKRLERIP